MEICTATQYAFIELAISNAQFSLSYRRSNISFFSFLLFLFLFLFSLPPAILHSFLFSRFLNQFKFEMKFNWWNRGKARHSHWIVFTFQQTIDEYFVAFISRFNVLVCHELKPNNRLFCWCSCCFFSFYFVLVNGCCLRPKSTTITSIFPIFVPNCVPCLRNRKYHYYYCNFYCYYANWNDAFSAVFLTISCLFHIKW